MILKQYIALQKLQTIKEMFREFFLVVLPTNKNKKRLLKKLLAHNPLFQLMLGCHLCNTIMGVLNAVVGISCQLFVGLYRSASPGV